MRKLFSRRKREQNSEIPDIFEYDNFPQEFRTQVYYILGDISEIFNYDEDLWNSLRNSFIREKGWKCLENLPDEGHYGDSKDECEHFFLKANNTDFLDYIDFAFGILDTALRDYYSRKVYKTISAEIDQAIAELNERLKYHNLGYEFINGELVRIDSSVLHQQAVKPSLQLLHKLNFAGANSEIMKAYAFRRTGDNKNAIAEANKSFESTMKAICDGMSYTYNSAKNTAKDLINKLEDNQFYPTYLNTHIAGIRITLESGAPTVRNKTSGHGQGAQVMQIPDEYVDYTLNLVATNIVFLAKLYESQKVTKP